MYDGLMAKANWIYAFITGINPGVKNWRIKKQFAILTEIR